MGRTLSKRNGMLEGLTDKEARFVLEYPVDYDAKKAAIRAGYSAKTAGQYGAKLLRKVKIQKALTKVQKRDLKKTEVKREDVLRELVNAVTWKAEDLVDETGRIVPPNQLPERAQCQVDGYRVKVLRSTTYEDGTTEKVLEIEYRMTPRAAAREQAMKHAGLFAPEDHRHLVATIPWDELCGAINPTDQVEARLLEEGTKGAKP